VRTGTQFSGTIPAGGAKSWFTHEWPVAWHVIWTVVPTTVGAANAKQVEWDVAVQKASASLMTYWVTVRNLTTSEVGVEARYAVVQEGS
jgi:hypothetical protein